MSPAETTTTTKMTTTTYAMMTNTTVMVTNTMVVTDTMMMTDTMVVMTDTTVTYTPMMSSTSRHLQQANSNMSLARGKSRVHMGRDMGIVLRMGLGMSPSCKQHS